METPLYKTLEQELNALLRGVSLECLVCGEFVLRGGRTDLVPGVRLAPARRRRSAGSRLQFDLAGRVTAGRSRRSRKVRTPKGRTLGKPQAAKADGKWHRKETATGARLSGDADGKGETVG